MDHARITRLRWRLRGAWQWPTFGAAVVGEALLLHLLPISSGTGLAGGVLLAGGVNLAIAAALAPLAGILVRRRRPDLPRAICRDYAATGLMIGAAGLLVGLGLAHRPVTMAARAAFRAQSDAVRAFVGRNAGPDYRAGIDRADSWQLDTDLYRTCVPGADPERRLCLIVNTALSPPGITVDPNRAPNSTYVGPNAVGRGRG